MCDVPALRFPEFTGEWKEERLDEIAELSKGVGISKEQLSEDGEPCILYGELYTKYKSEIIHKVISKTNIESSNLKHSKRNDVIIPCSGETAIDIAVARCVPFDNILLGGDLNIIRLHKDDGAFMAYQLNGKRKIDIAKLAQGVSVVHLYGDNIKAIKTYNPCLQEQQKIVKLLSMLDERMELQNKIIEKLETLIKGIIETVISSQKPNTLIKNWTLSKILCKWKQDSVISFSYIWILFSNISINWFIINPQFEIGIAHFFSISISERYTVFLTASSEGNESFDFVYFLIFPFRFSMRLVV